jgi:flagellar biosynthesis anti-sigma factor FlgM
MKIDSYRSHLDPAVQSERPESVKRVETDRADRTTNSDKRSDAVRLSPEAQLTAKAMADATRPEGVRADHVEQAKKLLASGELGKNADRLADAIIDRTIEAGNQVD